MAAKKTTAKTTAKKTTAKKTTAKKTAAKKTTAKKTAAKKATKKVVAITETQIQVQAYLLAEAEGFSGNPVEYWLQAEATLKAA